MSNENVAPIEDTEEAHEDSGKEETAESEEVSRFVTYVLYLLVFVTCHGHVPH